VQSNLRTLIDGNMEEALQWLANPQLREHGHLIEERLRVSRQ
jgi:hypothetical protein